MGKQCQCKLQKRVQFRLNSVSFKNLIQGIILDSKSTLERKGRGEEKKGRKKGEGEPWSSHEMTD
jgi:hypothetical protein